MAESSFNAQNCGAINNRLDRQDAIIRDFQVAVNALNTIFKQLAGNGVVVLG